MKSEFLTHITGVNVPTLEISADGTYSYNILGMADTTFYEYPLKDIRSLDHDTIDYVRLRTMAIEHYRRYYESYFTNGLFIQEDNIWTTTCEATKEEIDSNLSRPKFKILGGRGNGNVGNQNVMYVIDTNGIDPNSLTEPINGTDKISISIGTQGMTTEKDFKRVLSPRFIKEVIIKDPYLGDIVIKNPNYFKATKMTPDDVYNDTIREIDIIYSNSILKQSIKMYSDLMRVVINKVDSLPMPQLYKRKVFEHISNTTAALNENLSQKMGLN